MSLLMSHGTHLWRLVREFQRKVELKRVMYDWDMSNISVMSCLM